jgi:DNA-directed RNA polymerase omega subunit
MDTSSDIIEPNAEVQEEPPAPRPTAPPIDSRFLFVDVAAMRAKQLRRGALPRLDDDVEVARLPHKAERIAMEEVKRGLVLYEIPQPQTPPAE